MKIGIARLFTKNCNLIYNFKNIEKLYRKAVEKKLDMVIFSRLALTGFSVNEAFDDENFLNKNAKYVEKLLDLTMGEKTKILMGNLYYEKNYEENNNIYKEIKKDSALFVDDGYIDTIIFRKEINKKNILEDYKYFDKNSFLTYFNYNKKKFAVLLGDDIFSNFNVFLTSDNKPDYVICLDSSTKNIDEKRNHLIKLAKFANTPLFYVNNAGKYNSYLFKGEVLLINEDFDIVFEDIYSGDNLLEFEIDCEDGTELFLKDKPLENRNLYFLMKKIYKKNNIILNCENFNEKEIGDILNKDKNCRLISFNSTKKNRVENIDVTQYINCDLYKKLDDREQKIIKTKIVELMAER